MQGQQSISGKDDVCLRILDVLQNDMEAVPHIVQLLNQGEYRATPFTAEEIVPVVADMFFAGLLYAYRDTQTENGRRNLAFTTEQLRAEWGEDAENIFLQGLRTPANLVWSSWPLIDSIWFEPTEAGQRAWKAWATTQIE